MWAIIESALNLVAAFLDFLMVSSVSVPALQLVGIILASFLIGLLLGRITKRSVQQTVEYTGERDADRISLDFNRLTPLGPSQEEAVDNSVMDISDLRPDQIADRPAARDRKGQREPTRLKE